MKYLYFFALILLLSACGHSMTGSGNIVSERRSSETFQSISAAGPLHVDIKKGAQYSVIIETDDNIMPYVETSVSGGTLKIRVKDINSLTNSTINVHVICPDVKDINASASAEIISKDMLTAADNMDLNASSGSKIDIRIDAPSVNAEASSGAEIIASGRTKNVSASASSGSSVKAWELHAETAKAEASSGATVKVFASISVDGSASSGGDIKYTGGASNVKKHESSGGSVDPS